MARFAVYENPNPATRADVPSLLDVQDDLLDNLATRVVVPLIKVPVMKRAAKHLNRNLPSTDKSRSCQPPNWPASR